MSEAGLNEADITTAVLVFAHYLGIDLETESELLPIAEKALRNLPQGWELGIGDNENAGIPYFFNESTGESVWKHPKEGVYLKKVKEEKKRLQIEADDRKRNRKAEGAASGRNQAQSQQRNQSDRDRGHDDGNKGNKNDVNKTRSGKGQSTADDVEIIEVSDFFQDDEEEYSQKSSMKKNTAANAVVGKKKDSDGPTYGMSAADFLSDDEEEEEKGASNDHPLKDTNAKGKKNSTQWNEANSHLEKEKEIRNTKSSRSESISWDDKSSGSAHMSVGVSRHDNESRGGDSGSGSVIRGREEVVRGKDNRGAESNRIESAGSLSTRSNSPLPSKMDAREKSRERISKERDIRERESKDRDLREKESKEKESRERESRELREKDIREAELREREKNRVRMRDLEGSNAVASSALSAEVSALKADNRDLEDRLSDLRHRHQQVISDWIRSDV